MWLSRCRQVRGRDVPDEDSQESPRLIPVSAPFPFRLHTRPKDVSVAGFPVMHGHGWSKNCDSHQHSIR